MGWNMKIWIINNYAVPPKLGGLARHYYFSKFLGQMGHDVRIFAGSQIHNSPKNFVDKGKRIKEMTFDGVNYSYVNVMPYRKNDYRRIINILQFGPRAVKAMEELYNSGDKPDIIYSSSPIPNAAKSVMKFAKKHKIPFIFEVRDLWPKSLLDYGILKDNLIFKPAISYLYNLEHSLYRGADRLIFTMAGGASYIDDMGWSDIDRDKIFQVNNGLDLEEFDKNLRNYHFDDQDLDDKTLYKLVYMGSVRSIYDLDIILDAAGKIANDIPELRILIFGRGPELERLKRRQEEQGINNVKFKGGVEKNMIPSVLSRADACLLHHRKVDLLKYGTSNNKLFEYAAAGKPILSTVKSRFSLIEEYKLGPELEDQDPDNIESAIRRCMTYSKSELEDLRLRARQMAEAHDYRRLARKLEEIFENLL